MAKIKKDNIEASFWILNFLGSKLGGILTLVSILGFTATAAYFANNFVKNAEILDIKTAFATKEIDYKEDISKLRIELFKLQQKISEYEKGKKK